MSKHFEFIVIGGGSAGYTAASVYGKGPGSAIISDNVLDLDHLP